MREDRWITLVPTTGEWTVVDDFIWPTASGRIDSGEHEGGRLRYFDRKGLLLREW
jgi:hypothetical protein